MWQRDNHPMAFAFHFRMCKVSAAFASRAACLATTACFVTALCLAACAAPAHGQATIKTEVKQVLVPVVVTDKSGHYITGLHVSDFHIAEDAIPQTIASFAVSSSPHQLLGAPEAWIPPAGSENGAFKTGGAVNSSPRRTYLVCIDTLHSTFSNFGRVRDALKKLFQNESAGESQYALIALGRQPHVIQDSTRDPKAVLTTIASSNFMKTVVDTESAKLANDIQQFTYFMRDIYCTWCACDAFNTADSPRCPAAQTQLQAYLLRSGERTRILDEGFYQALQQLLSAMATMPTTRTVVFISDGFNRFPGRELYAVMSGFAPKDHRFEFNPRDMDDRLQNVLKIAVDHDIRFYTIDSRGLYTGALLGGSTFDASTDQGAHIPQRVDFDRMTVAHENTDALATLARDTGGLFFENNNDLLKGIKRAFADGRDYYLLSYIPKNKLEDGTFRHILVQVSNKKWRVNAKAGYWAPKR